MSKIEKVAFLAVHAYHKDLLRQSVDRLVSVHGMNRSYASSVILLKPNLISSRNSSLACTDPALLQTVAKWFLDRNAKVKVGDSPAFGSSHSVLNTLGCLSNLKRLGVEVVEFNRVKRVQLPNGMTVHLAAEARECDLLVNLPRIKAHIQLRLTMAVKNLFGCICGMKKAWYHMIHGGHKKGDDLFSELIVQLPALLPPVLSLTDGIKVMHKSGPIDGEALDIGILGSSLNPIALDTAFTDILSIGPEMCPLYLAAKRLQLPGHDIDDVRWLLKEKKDFDIPEFKVPDELIPIRFNPLRFIKSSTSRFYQRHFSK